MQDWKRFSYTVPIKEHLFQDNDFLIKGIAINSTMTRNGVLYAYEELEKSAHTLKNKPLLKDHNNSVDSIVGRTTGNITFSSEKKCIEFEAKILEPKIKEMISDGRIQSVSIGAAVRDLIPISEEDGGGVKAVGINFLELSLVAVPADPNAGFVKAIFESYNLKNRLTSEMEKMSNHNKEEYLKGDNKMVEELKTLEQLKVEREKLQLELEELQIKKLKEELLQLKSESKDLTKGIVKENEDDDAEEINNDLNNNGSFVDAKYNLEKSEIKGYALTGNYKALGLKRYAR